MADLRLTLTQSVVGSTSKTAGLSSVVESINNVVKRVIAYGTGNNQANKVYTLKDQSIAASGVLDVDLSGALVDAYGVACVFTKVKALQVVNKSAIAVITIGNDAASFVGPFGDKTHTITLQPGESIMLTNILVGWTVTAGTADILQITNDDGAEIALVDVMVVGL